MFKKGYIYIKHIFLVEILKFVEEDKSQNVTIN